MIRHGQSFLSKVGALDRALEFRYGIIASNGRYCRLNGWEKCVTRFEWTWQ